MLRWLNFFGKERGNDFHVAYRILKSYMLLRRPNERLVTYRILKFYVLQGDQTGPIKGGGKPETILSKVYYCLINKIVTFVAPGPPSDRAG